MKKHGWKLILCIIIAVPILVWLLMGPIFSYYFTDKLRLPVSISRITIWPTHTKIHNFRLQNPHGFKKDAALKVEHTRIDYNFHHLFRDPTEFDQIVLDGVVLNIELSKDKISNWTVIGSHMAKEDQKSREVLIHKLILTNITVEISGLGTIAGLSVPRVQHFDRWEFDEIDSQHGFPTQDIIQKLFQQAGLLQFFQGIFNQTLDIPKTVNPLRIF